MVGGLSVSYSYSSGPRSPRVGSVKVLTSASPMTLSRTYLSLMCTMGPARNGSGEPLIGHVRDLRKHRAISCTRAVKLKDGGCRLMMLSAWFRVGSSIYPPVMGGVPGRCMSLSCRWLSRRCGPGGAGGVSGQVLLPLMVLPTFRAKGVRTTSRPTGQPGVVLFVISSVK